MRLVLSALLIVLVAGHGEMTFPPSRSTSSLNHWCTNGACLWFSQGCQAGCSECTDTFKPGPCKTPMTPTVTDPKYRTYPIYADYEPFKANPWRSPGHAPVFSACGIAGGGDTYNQKNGAFPPPGVKQGTDGRDFPELSAKTEWPQGSEQEVAWSMTANHGGGYAYRLCPKGAKEDMEEECFQRHHLQFASEQSWIQYGDDKSNRTVFTATRLSEGTNPKGSQWTKNPIPPCGDLAGGAGQGMRCLQEQPQFEPPIPGLYGFGAAACLSGDSCSDADRKYWGDKFLFNIIDKVQVPTDLPTGDYLLSFRWDCEQTPQIWSQCSDVTITAKDVLVV